MSLVRNASGLIVRGESLGGSNECCCGNTPCQSCFFGNDLWVQAPGCNIAEPANCANVPLSGFPPLRYARRRCLEGETVDFATQYYGTVDRLEFIPGHQGIALTTYSWSHTTLLQNTIGLCPGGYNSAIVDEEGEGYTVRISLVCGGQAGIGMRVIEASAARREQKNKCVPRLCSTGCMEIRGRTFNYFSPADFVYPWKCAREPFTITANHTGVDYAGTFVPWAGIQDFPTCTGSLPGMCQEAIPTFELPNVSLTFYVRPCKKDNPLP